MPDRKETPGYYSIITAEVRYDKSLSPNAKLLYGEISSLCNVKGYCWASNKYFAELYGVNRSSITHWIKQLVDAGHINQQFIYAEGQPNITERRLYLSSVLPDISIPQNHISSENTEIPVIEGGGEILHQGGGEIFNQGGEKTQEILINSINKISSSSDLFKILIPKDQNSTESAEIEGGGDIIHHGGEILHQGGGQQEEEAAPLFVSNSPETGFFGFSKSFSPPDGPPDVMFQEAKDLKQHLKQLNAELIFNEDFYKKAVIFISQNQLDFGYASWLFGYCEKKQVTKSIAGFYFTVFFQSRFIELYKESLKKQTLPQKIEIMCPVCDAQNGESEAMCPQCGFNKAYRNDHHKVKNFKLLYSMSEDTRNVYENELEAIFTDDSLHFEEQLRRRRNLDSKFGFDTS